MKKIIFYQISDNFKNVFLKEALKVFLEIQKRSNECDNVKKQFDMFIEKTVVDSFTKLVIERFNNKTEFTTLNENHFKIKNPITKDEEELFVYEDFIELIYGGKHSQFLDFITLYYPSMVAINQKTNEIVSLNNLTHLSLI